MSRSPSFCAARWAGRNHTSRFPGSLGVLGLSRRAGWRTIQTVATVGQFLAAAAVPAVGSRDGIRGQLYTWGQQNGRSTLIPEIMSGACGAAVDKSFLEVGIHSKQRG